MELPRGGQKKICLSQSWQDLPSLLLSSTSMAMLSLIQTRLNKILSSACSYSWKPLFLAHLERLAWTEFPICSTTQKLSSHTFEVVTPEPFVIQPCFMNTNTVTFMQPLSQAPCLWHLARLAFPKLVVQGIIISSSISRKKKKKIYDLVGMVYCTHLCIT